MRDISPVAYTTALKDQKMWQTDLMRLKVPEYYMEVKNEKKKYMAFIQ